MKCRYSNYMFDKHDSRIKWTVVVRITKKEKMCYEADAVLCPCCGRELVPRKHPNSFFNLIIPAHNKP